MKTFSLILSLSVLTGCLSKTISPETSSGNINAAAPYVWSEYSAPKNLAISASFSTEEETNIIDMYTEWEIATANKKDLFTHTLEQQEVSSTTLNLDSLGDDNVYGVYKITHWPTSLERTALAVTQIFGIRYNIGKANEYVRIEHADILINDHLYNFRTTNTGSGFDLQTVILHELGHFMGLPHRSSGTTIMRSSISDRDNIRTPSNIDRYDVAAKYGFTLTTTSGSGIATALPDYSPNPGEQGKKVRLLIELRAEGECVHKENGVVIGRHSVK